MSAAKTPEQVLADAIAPTSSCNTADAMLERGAQTLTALRAAGWDVTRAPSPTSAETAPGHVERLTRWRDERIPSHDYQMESVKFRRDVIALLAECERLHAAATERQVASTALRAARDRDPSPDTIPVRVRVLVRANGRYAATGHTDARDDDMQDTLWMMLDVEEHCDEVTHTLTAHVPLPRSVEVVANVEVGT